MDAEHEVVGPYRLVERLGDGASGTVWRAVGPPPLRREVALKRAAPEPAALAALRREAEILAAVDHPGLPRPLATIDRDGEVAVALPLAAGGTLHALVATAGPLAPGQVVAVVGAVADAVVALHRHGWVHGDVRAANVCLTVDGDPLLVDLGAARPLDEGGAVADVRALARLGHLCLTGRDPDPARPLSGDDGPDALVAVLAAALGPAPTDLAAFAVALRRAVPPAAVVLPGGHTPPHPTGGWVRRADGARRVEAVAPPPRPTRPFGEAPPAARADRGRRRWRRPALVAGLAVLVVGWALVVGGRAPGPTPAPGPAVEAASRPSVPATTASTTAPAASQPAPDPSDCPTPSPFVPRADEVTLRGDLRGDGCIVTVGWDGSVLRVPDPATGHVRRYRLAPRSDAARLLLGDWDCDGTQTPARRVDATGEVVYFAALPDEIGEVLAPERRRVLHPGRGVEVVRRGACDRLRPTAPPSGPGG